MLYELLCSYFYILQFLLRCIKEGLNKYFWIWTKFDSVDTEAGMNGFYGEMYENLTTVLCPMASLAVCGWCLSIESLTDRIVIFRPSLWIREVISVVSVGVVVWNLRRENLRWLRSFSVLGKMMTLLTWRWPDLSLKGAITHLCVCGGLSHHLIRYLNFTWHHFSPGSGSLVYTSHTVVQCHSPVPGLLALWHRGIFLPSSFLRLFRAWEICVVWIGRNVRYICHKYSPVPSLEVPWDNSLSHSMVDFKLLFISKFVHNVIQCPFSNISLVFKPPFNFKQKFPIVFYTSITLTVRYINITCPYWWTFINASLCNHHQTKK